MDREVYRNYEDDDECIYIYTGYILVDSKTKKQYLHGPAMVTILKVDGSNIVISE